MHKSALTFGLLASSLVMLIIMPFLNHNNSFLSNTVMAQEYDKYGDSSYSQYPTDDKKYECRTGPFEGFFVSSVEFCKHIKFDDNKDDRKDIIEIIKQEHKVHLVLRVLKVLREFKAHLVRQEASQVLLEQLEQQVHRNSRPSRLERN